MTSAIALMCERGVHATGLRELLEHSGTARRSIYQNFPGGKSELIEYATRVAGRHLSRQIAEFLEAGPASGVEALIDDWISTLLETDYVRGCPINAAAQSGPSEPAIQAAAADVFTAWRNQFVGAFVEYAIPIDTAEMIADVTISTIEGAIVQSRASRSISPLANAKEVLIPMIRGFGQSDANLEVRD
ncbi:TetR family transcriptional regulator [Hoyosella altamirensis]|uniref:LmrA/YxaF family transcription factor n=1 Tax=Hoyosella altamirensis TaxID=616997 RepID=UPI00162269A8